MNILVTGGARGLGKLISESLIELNHQVFILDRLPSENFDSTLLKKISYYFEVDLRDIDELTKVLNVLIEKYERIDIIINNAALREFSSFVQFSDTSIYDNIKVNFQTPLLIIKKFLPLMIKYNFGRIINISSISGLYGYSQGTLYCATKSALITFTEALASDLSELGKNITANAILPDSFQTREGEKFKSYKYITNKIIKTIIELIVSNKNGKIFIVTPPRKKMIELLKALFRTFKRFCN